MNKGNWDCGKEKLILIERNNSSIMTSESEKLKIPILSLTNWKA